MPDINEEYERYLKNHVAGVSKKIRKVYDGAINEVMLNIDKVTFKGQVFSLSEFPGLKRQIDAQVKKMHGNIYTAIVNGVQGSWDLSNRKNDLIVDRRIGKKAVNSRVRKVLFDPNAGALKQFVARKEKGMNLSQRIWKSLEPFKGDLEIGLGLGISEGKPAKEMAKELKKYLLEPDRLYHRVRDKDGKLKLSRAAKEYNPGRGIYRSSYKNAARLTRTENNMAYRTADHERWANMPFVLGFEVKLSWSHKHYDICDNLKGKYPKDFDYKGWHPHCLCYKVPIMMSDEEYDKLEDSILGIADFDPNSAQQVTATPVGFDKFVRENKKRIAGWSNEPYWVKDNKSYYEKAAASKKAKPEMLPAGRTIADQFTNIDNAIKKKAKAALSEIDKVHGDGDLIDIPINKMVGQSAQAMFTSSIKGDPLYIKISTTAIDPEFSMVHEMGHYLDLHAMGKRGRFESAIHGSPVNDVVKAAQETDSIKGIQKLLDQGFMEYKGKQIPLSPTITKHFEYLVSPEEIWARAYSQFIAKRSQSGVMLKSVQARIASGEKYGITYQWVDNDFLSLEKAIEDLMLKNGWIVNR